jgi:predicted DNA-binding transcriptional regulator AlpA
MPNKLSQQDLDHIGVLRKREVAAQLGISKWTLDHWVKDKKFPPPTFLQVGSPAVWRVRVVKDFLDKARRARRPKRSPRGMLRNKGATK